MESFEQNDFIDFENEVSPEAIQAAVDYRGDTKIELKNGTEIEGYLYDFDGKTFSLFPNNSPEAEQVLLTNIKKITFTGKDTAKGKSWEDWMSKKDSERQALAAEPVLDTL